MTGEAVIAPILQSDISVLSMKRLFILMMIILSFFRHFLLQVLKTERLRELKHETVLLLPNLSGQTAVKKYPQLLPRILTKHLMYLLKVKLKTLLLKQGKVKQLFFNSIYYSS